jgi:hypothetical protein
MDFLSGYGIGKVQAVFKLFAETKHELQLLA